MNTIRCDECDRLKTILEKVKQTCLFDEDDGQTGVTTDPHIGERLFNEICEATAKAKGD